MEHVNYLHQVHIQWGIIEEGQAGEHFQTTLFAPFDTSEGEVLFFRQLDNELNKVSLVQVTLHWWRWVFTKLKLTVSVGCTSELVERSSSLRKYFNPSSY